MMSNAASLTAFNSWLQSTTERFEQLLGHHLASVSFSAPPLKEAARYSALTAGKRIRPLFIYAVGEIYQTHPTALDPAALAIELIHSYSLVHDDLPAMDNSEWRRGKPSCFKAYGEDMAILAGDGLQTLAFEILATYPAPLSAEQRLTMVQILSRAAGLTGMVGGQALDILNTQDTISENKLLEMYSLKTGALIEACFSLASAASHAPDNQSQALVEYARCISLAFQIQDDLLDIEGKADITGKPTGLDTTLQKQTYPLLIGLEAAKLKIQSLFSQASQVLQPFSDFATHLNQLVLYLQERKK
jgi:farnesyl diphosphate synthase